MGTEIPRRAVLSGVGALALGGLAGTAGGRESNRTDEGYVLRQGDACVPLDPLPGDQTATAFYDWREAETNYSSAGTTDLQRPDTSLVFLYRAADGGVYLVIVHDQYNAEGFGSPGDGGSVSFTFEGLTGGEWLVRDDLYDGASNYDQWNDDGTPQQVDWTYGDARTDGGVYGPLPADLDVTIRPAFNEDAALYDDYYQGTIAEWQALAGSREDPTRTTLDRSQPIRITRGTCGGGEATLDVDIVPGRLNPRSHGLLPVDLRPTDGLSLAALDLGTLRVADSGARPVRAARTGNNTLRVFFRVQSLDVPHGGSYQLTLQVETSGGTRISGRDSVDLVPNRRDDEDEERSRRDDDRDGHDDADRDRGRRDDETDREKKRDTSDEDDRRDRGRDEDHDERGRRDDHEEGPPDKDERGPPEDRGPPDDEDRGRRDDDHGKRRGRGRRDDEDEDDDSRGRERDEDDDDDDDDDEREWGGDDDDDDEREWDEEDDD